VKKAVRPVTPHRDVIVREAMREFASKGFAGATTVAIAKRAGITQPLIHHHFGSKEKLWAHVLSEVFGSLTRALIQADDPRGGERARIERLLRTLVAFASEHPELSRLIRLESAGGGAPFEHLYREHLEPLLQFFEAIVKRAVTAGQMRRAPPGFIYFATIGLCTQLFAEPATAKRAFGIDARSPKTAAAYADFVVGVFFDALWVTSAS
jgi:AcrR family transcriptional regulator